MSRLASAGKMQYYPTSTPDIACIAERLQAAGKPRLLDPCAGQGDALAVLHEALARTSQPASYAVELDTERARRCRQHFPATTINASWEDVVSSNKIEDTTHAAGPAGAPSGVVFAALQAHGMRLTTYQQILAALVNAGWITIDANHLIRLPAKAATP